MSVHNPPYYRYSLFDPWDKEAFKQIKEIAKTKNYPKITGSSEDKNQFLITLIRTQKALDDWRNMAIDVLKQVKETNTIDTGSLNKKYPPEIITQDKPAWVTYEEDKIVSDFIDQLADKHITFTGSDNEISEFVIRFILGQLGHDWEQTIMLIWEILGDQDTIELKELNREFQNFDYLRLFGT